ncbi:ABC-2 type transport system permease protein [Agrococcus baldri]|uniref:ABC-2 type transport system permease protein n=1 Tax=Agrococcus baldri TaxID=153730 RepID=A0AA94HLS6_9MICO|nr:ABC transporter permease [Agrococcus baldri]SFS08936.1 ABC-2 type transport system permease protein [Agrococcus baldri]
MSATAARTGSTASATNHRGRTGFWAATGIVAQREIMTRLRSKSFIISTAIMLALILGGVIFASVGPALFDEDTAVATVAAVAPALQGLSGLDLSVLGTADAVRQAVQSGAVDAGVVPGSGPSGLLVLADREAPSSLIQMLSVAPELELLDANAPDPMLTYYIGIAFGIVFFSSAMTFGTTIAQSVVEEKQSRIVEIMLAAVPARAILAGKVVGNSVLAFGQILLIAAAVMIGGAITGSQLVLDGLGMPIVWFVVLFTVGFVMLAALYAAAAALVSRAEDLGTATSPVMMLIMIPYFAVIIFNNSPVALQIMSYVPFSAPVAVPMRVYLQSQAWWEPFLSLAILAAFTVLVIAFAAKVYERSLLKTGSMVKWKDALKG